jgi:hypothetical protein
MRAICAIKQLVDDEDAQTAVLKSLFCSSTTTFSAEQRTVRLSNIRTGDMLLWTEFFQIPANQSDIRLSWHDDGCS